MIQYFVMLCQDDGKPTPLMNGGNIALFFDENAAEEAARSGLQGDFQDFQIYNWPFEIRS